MKSLIKHLLRETLIKEGASSVLYHFTNVRNLINILSTNTFNLTTNIGTTSDKIGADKSYYMSFTRTKSVIQGYGRGFRFNGAVRIKLDGQKLSQNYKIKPVDYWQYPKTLYIMKQLSGDEMEDRLVTDKDEIVNANKYIISIDILITKDNTVNQKLIDLAKDLNIQLYFFNDEKDFASGLTQRAINPNVNNDTIENREYIRLDNIAGALTYKNPDKYQEVLNVIGDKWKIQIDDYHKKLSYYLRYDNDYNLTDITRSIEADINNQKREPNKLLRYIIRELALDMKKTNSKSIKDYLRQKIYINKKTQQDYNKQFNTKLITIIDNTYNEELNAKRNSFSPVYDKENGNEYDGIFNFPPAKEFIDRKINEIKKYVSNYVLNNDDMFKYSYVLSDSYIREEFDIKDNNTEAINIANMLEDVWQEEIIKPLKEIVWAIDNFYYKEIKDMQEEEAKQWQNN